MSTIRQASDYVYERGYRGKIKGTVLDWSGTVADAYVIAPAVVFVEVFRKKGVEISMLEARGPMGLRKDLHIEWRESDDHVYMTGPVELEFVTEV